MLILSRKIGEKIIINDNIELTILDFGNNNVKLGIQAPLGVKIFREEVYNAVKEANLESNNTTTHSLDTLNKITDIENFIVKKYNTEDK